MAISIFARGRVCHIAAKMVDNLPHHLARLFIKEKALLL